MSRRRKKDQWPVVRDLPDIRPILRGPRLAGALCIGRGHLWDDTLHREPADARAARHDTARRICARCPAARQCDELAQQVPAEHRRGIWAGTLYGPNIIDDEENAA